MSSRIAIAAAVLIGIAAGTSSAQAPRKLGAPTAKHDGEFTGIQGVRELTDGRVIVLDGQEKAIHVIDFKSSTARKIGADGDGPGEYRLPLEIWPLSGDSSVVRDMARFGKLLVITPKGETGDFVSLVDSALSTRNFIPTGSDLAGRLYGLERPGNALNDSARIVRWDRAKRTRDTVAMFTTSTTPPRMSEADVLRDKDGKIIGYRPGPARPFLAFNQWVVAGDGRVAIVQAVPYRVVYIHPNASRTVGPTIPYQPVPVTDAEKDAWRAEASRPVASITFGRGGTTNTATYRKPRPIDNVEWESVMPPFMRNAVTFASDGSLWVKRSTKAGAAPLYDVFDRTGRVAYQVELPAMRKLLGFGNGVVYLARVDDDDLHYLERYALPKP